MARDLFLAFDVGTGSTRSALVDATGRILAFESREHDQIVPKFGWSEQRPDDWWAGIVRTARAVLSTVDDAANQIAAVCACGQMHGTVLIDDDGNLTMDAVPLWNDKRTIPQVEAFAERSDDAALMDLAANVPAPAWPAFKLLWILENRPEALEAASTVLMPKDYVNFKLTGMRGQDWTEASMSFLMDRKTRCWSEDLVRLTGVPTRLLPPIRRPDEVLGGLTPSAAALLGLQPGIPVLAGAGDYPAALLGSGAALPGLGSDVTGTSTIITLVQTEPALSSEVSNVATVEGNWGTLTLLDAGGDAVRWARRAFHENRRSFNEIEEAARLAEPGSNGLFFLPYLSGERLGAHRNSRAQLFGLTASHGLAELHRAVLEGVAFSVRLKLDRAQLGERRPSRIIAAGGGAKSKLWLKIKASMYDVPYLVPEELECGIVGSAVMMSAAVGMAPSLAEAVGKMVRFETEVLPIPEWSERYDRMMPIFERLYLAAREFHSDLDALDAYRGTASADKVST